MFWRPVVESVSSMLIMFLNMVFVLGSVVVV